MYPFPLHILFRFLFAFLQFFCNSTVHQSYTHTILSHGSPQHSMETMPALALMCHRETILSQCPVFSPPLTPVCCEWQFAPVSTEKFQLDHTVAVRQIGIIHHHYQNLRNNITPIFTSCHISMQLMHVPILYLVLPILHFPSFFFCTFLVTTKYLHYYKSVKNLKT